MKDFGRSILVTYSPFEADVWLRHFAGGEFEEIRPTLGDAPLENHVLDLMASGLASSRAELEEMLLSSFTGWAHWAQKISRARVLGGARRRRSRVGLGGGLLRALEDDRLEVTAVGPRVRRQGDRRRDRRRRSPSGRGRRSASPVEDLEVL